jgi:fructokinase
MGGAPANFAIHAHALGADARLVTCVGDDELGREILERLHSLGFPTELVTVHPTAPTGTVSVELSAGGQPRYTIHENVAWDFIPATAAALEAAAAADVICFGSLAQRSAASGTAIRTLVTSSRETALRICDINLRAPFVSREVITDSLAIANVLKLNDAELPILAEMCDLQGEESQLMRDLAKRFNLRAIALTRGDKGSTILADGQFSNHFGLPAEVRDTIGAGDAFTAALAIGLVGGWALDTINEHANAVAAFVCSQPGATPELPASLCASFLNPACPLVSSSPFR